jgi:hypothetical protein
MHILFNWAMKWELIDLDRMNPMKLVRVEGSSKRLRQPRTLTVKEFRFLLERLEEPKTVAGVTTTYIVDTFNPTGYAQVVTETVSGTGPQSY